MKEELRRFLSALQFLTRVPVPAWVGGHAALQADSVRYFPLVGLLVGALGSGVLWLAAHHFPALVALLLALVAMVWLTGALHEDGLADTCDALGGSAGRERALAIMKDPHLGSYGVLGLVCVLALKVAALHALATRDFVLTLVLLPLAHAWSRAACVALMRWLPYAGDVSRAKAPALVARRSAGGEALTVLLWTLAFGAGASLLMPLPTVLGAALAVLMVVLYMARMLRRRLGGFTGDTLGAAQQLCELAAYLAVLAVSSHG